MEELEGCRESQRVLFVSAYVVCMLSTPPDAPTMPGTGPIGEPPAAAPGRSQRGGGCVHPRSSLSRDSGGHSGEHSGSNPDSGGLAGVAVGTEVQAQCRFPQWVERAEGHSLVPNLGDLPGGEARSPNLVPIPPTRGCVCISPTSTRQYLHRRSGIA